MLLLNMLDNVKHAVASPFESKPHTQSAPVTAKAASAAASTGTASGTGSTANQATITANDFLTLLVTEIQNQDPTTQTDPMQYITQLVGVNSLEQLVQINQTLSTGTGSVTPTAGAASSRSANSATPSAAVAKSASLPASQTGSQTGSSAQAAAAGHLLPLGSNTQIPTSSETAVAQAFTHASTLPTQTLAPSQVPLSPAMMKALQHSIPGATLTGVSDLPAATTAGAGGAVR